MASFLTPEDLHGFLLDSNGFTWLLFYSSLSCGRCTTRTFMHKGCEVQKDELFYKTSLGKTALPQRIKCHKLSVLKHVKC